MMGEKKVMLTDGIKVCFMERLGKDYGKVGNRNSGIMVIRKIDQNVRLSLESVTE